MKLCDTCRYRNNTEYEKPCILYRDDCEFYEKERGDMTREDIKTITDIVHKTIYGFFDVCGDDEETPMTDKNKLLLKVNKTLCNNIKALEQEPCGDVISRTELLKAIDTWDKFGYSARYGLERLDKDDKGYVPYIHYDDVIKCIKGMASVNLQEPKWIPVSERLPEDKQSVLVWCPQYKNIYCAYLEKEQWWIFGAFVQIVPNEVVAWMPLPEPYKPD